MHRNFSSELGTRGILGFISWMARDYSVANGFDRDQYISELSLQLIRDWIVTETKIQPFFHRLDRWLPLCTFGRTVESISTWPVRETNWGFYPLHHCGQDLANNHHRLGEIANKRVQSLLSFLSKSCHTGWQTISGTRSEPNTDQ